MKHEYHAYTLELNNQGGTVIGYWDAAYGCFETDWISTPRIVKNKQTQEHAA
jgi:hypothetical protein